MPAWVRDSDFRFFPALKHDLFGYRLHVADLATNKALAAVAKDPGYSPESLIREISRNARYLPDDYADLSMAEPIDAAVVSRRFRNVLEEADAFVRAMPPGRECLLFLKDGEPVQPDPENIEVYTAHAGRRGGYWPSSSEIGSAMVRHHGQKPAPG
jgi:hypothetical protein